MNNFAEGFMAHFNLNVYRWRKGKGSDNKIPAYAVLITILNLSKKWAPGVICFRLSATRLGKSGHAHRKQE